MTAPGRVTGPRPRYKRPYPVAIGPVVGALVASWLGASGAGAAEVRLRAAEGCVEADSIAEQADGILGQPVASVEGVDFEVTITKGPEHGWNLRLDTIDRIQGSRRTRELTAGSCAELADASAVAIVVSIKASTERDTRRQPKVPEKAANAPSGTAERAPEPPPPSSPQSARTASAALGIMADSGAMPRPSLGVGIAAVLQWRSFRLVGEGALFLSQDTQLASGSGGHFQLSVVATLACLTGGLWGVTLLACGGGEVGRLAGTGFGVSRPRTEGTLWLAGRAEGGATIALGPRLALLLRAGVALPAMRPSFQLDASTFYRASALTKRATTGIEIVF